MNNELISIIVPIFNVENYLEKTIESILNQTYTNIEVLCIDDGSTDNSLQKLNEIASKDSRIKVFSKENNGVTLARKNAYEHAAGEYVGFVDADDIIEPTMYERLYNNMLKYNADISHCGHDILWLDGKRSYYYNTGQVRKQKRIDGIESLLLGSFEPGLCNKLYKYDLLKSLFHSDFLDYSIKINEDLLMNYYLFKQADSTVLEDVCLYHYVKREGSASSSKMNSNLIWDQINVKNIILDDSKDSEYEMEAHKAFILTCIHVYNSLINNDSVEFIDDKEQIESLIISEKKYFKLLDKKYKVLAKILSVSPKAYLTIYKLFS